MGDEVNCSEEELLETIEDDEDSGEIDCQEDELIEVVTDDESGSSDPDPTCTGEDCEIYDCAYDNPDCEEDWCAHAVSHESLPAIDGVPLMDNYVDDIDCLEDSEIIDVVSDGSFIEVGHESIASTDAATGVTSKVFAEQSIEVNLVPGGVLPVLRCSQYDNGYQIRITIYNGTTEYVIPKTCSVTFEMTKSDGTVFSCNAKKVTTNDSQCYIWMSKDMSRIGGDHICQLVISNTTNRSIGTANFILAVEPAPVSRKSTKVPESTILDIREAISLIGNLRAYADALEAKADSSFFKDEYYNRTWTFGPKFASASYATVWHSGHVVVVTFAAVCATDIPKATSAPIITNLPATDVRVYLTPTIVTFVRNSKNKAIPNSIKTQCVCAMRTGKKQNPKVLQVDGNLNPTPIKKGEVIYGTFSYITSDTSAAKPKT